MKLSDQVRTFLVANAQRRAFAIQVASRINGLGAKLMSLARAPVRLINSHVTDGDSDSFVYGLPILQDKIRDVLVRQKREYPHYSYFDGQPYQSLGILGIFGERATEERFIKYGLAGIVGSKDRVLDIGCNCGFMSVITAFRTGCHAVGVDINPYMIEIGNLAAQYLGISDKVSLVAGRFQDYETQEKFSVVFSFATHWTDDGNYRVALADHFHRISGFLADGGTLVFETHSADVGQANFYAALKQAKEIFEFSDTPGLIDKGTREFYIMRKRR